MRDRDVKSIFHEKIPDFFEILKICKKYTVLKNYFVSRKIKNRLFYLTCNNLNLPKTYPFFHLSQFFEDLDFF